MPREGGGKGVLGARRTRLLPLWRHLECLGPGLHTLNGAPRFCLCPLCPLSQNKKETAPKQAVKEKSKAARRARYDLESKKSLPLLIADRQAAHKRSREEDAGAAGEGFEGAFPTQAPGGRAASVEELRARLRARIEELRSKRQASDKSGKAAKSKEPRADGSERPSAKRPRQDDAAAKAAAAAAEGEDLDDSLAFGTVSSVPRGMAGIKAKEMAAAQRKKRASLSTLLEKAEAHRTRVEALKGTEEGEQVRGEHDWDAALRRATGEKVRDDPKLLKRSIKREERSKKKSATKWRDRETQKTEEREARQAKRDENLKKRSEGKGGKAKAASKSGGKGGSKGGKPKAKARSGFEGSSRKSLN